MERGVEREGLSDPDREEESWGGGGDGEIEK